jgi:hypothetical protein
MVSSAHGYDTLPPLLSGQSQSLVESPADFEGTGFLKQFQLHVDIGLETFAQRRAGGKRCPAHAGRDALPGILNVRERQSFGHRKLTV